MLKFEIQSEDDDNEVRVIEKTMAVMEAAIHINSMWIRRHPEDKCLLTSGAVKYDFSRQYKLSDTIDIKTASVMKSTGLGLCIDFICLDVAVRRFFGESAAPYVSFGDRRGVFHVQTMVVDQSGETILDPAEEISKYGWYINGHVSCRP